MTTDGPCHGVQERLTDAFLAREAPGAEDRAHAEACSACGALRADLRVLADVLDARPLPELGAERAAALRRRATAELSAAAAIRPATAGLPPGYRRELVRLLAWAALPLPAVLLVYAALFRFGAAFLADWLPAALVTAIGAAFALGTASWMALIYGSIPFVAQRAAVRRTAQRMAAATPLDSR
ncbi:MAG: hypothetical protein OEM05_06655 [Myxococcales bacterium]|nr:hypothetical protein [Myxococcales bacterium]